MTDRLQEIRDRWAAASPGLAEKLITCRGYAEIRIQCQTINLMPRPVGYSFGGRAADVQAMSFIPEDIVYLLGEVERLRASLVAIAEYSSPQDPGDLLGGHAILFQAAAQAALGRPISRPTVEPGVTVAPAPEVDQ